MNAAGGIVPPTIQCALNLPDNFRVGDFLDFHKRDTAALAERVSCQTVRKGISWNGRSACLAIHFGGRRADIELVADGPFWPEDLAVLSGMARRMLGLTQNVAAFEEAHRNHPGLGPIVARQQGLRVPLSATPFEALTWAVTGQQISVKAALSLRRNLILAAGLRHSSGLACYPDAERLLALTEDDLHKAGFSRAKATTLMTLCRRVADGGLPLDAWAQDFPDAGLIGDRLVQIRGIGSWTINYTLLRGFGWLDGSLHGDVAVRRGLRRLLGCSEPVGPEQAERWLADFTPWRALAAAHLWAYSVDW